MNKNYFLQLAPSHVTVGGKKAIGAVLIDSLLRLGNIIQDTNRQSSAAV